MWRVLLVLLVLANVAFFAWRGGWLEPGLPPPQHGERQPDRIAQQVRPEAVTVLGERAASAAITAARAASMALGEGEQCIELGPFALASVPLSASAASAASGPASAPAPALVGEAWSQTEALLTGAGLTADLFRRRDVEVPARTAVALGPYASNEARAQRMQELRERNIATESVALPPASAPGLVLARHEGLAAAEAAVPGWLERGVRNARAVVLAPATGQAWMRLERSRGSERERIRALTLPEGVALRNCPASR
ncbi:MAG: hypothetical protein ACOVQT_16315 [Rubrivivax sp.]|jgi:hypothetical protein